MRDDFSEVTKQQLAKRAGYYCSFPTCGSMTIGPSSESITATSSVGTAAHIVAASPGKGARRYVASMTSKQRKDISNGIWMCNTHGKLIDTDETRFSISVLNHWKQITEDVATTMVEKGCDYKTALSLMQGTKLARNEIQIIETPVNGIENELIGNTIFDSCIPILWGEHLSDAIRDYAIEHARNAFTHGGATLFELSIKDNKLLIVDNGTDYNPRTLFGNNSETGGALSVTRLLTEFGNKIVLATERIRQKNQTTISILKNLQDIFDITPCSIEISFEDFKISNLPLTINETCKEMYVTLPSFLALSDARRMPARFPQLQNHSSSLIFIVNKTSSFVIQMIAKNYPDSHIIVLH